MSLSDLTVILPTALIWVALFVIHFKRGIRARLFNLAVFLLWITAIPAWVFSRLWTWRNVMLQGITGLWNLVRPKLAWAVIPVLVGVLVAMVVFEPFNGGSETPSSTASARTVVPTPMPTAAVQPTQMQQQQSQQDLRVAEMQQVQAVLTITPKPLPPAPTPVAPPKGWFRCSFYENGVLVRVEDIPSINYNFGGVRGGKVGQLPSSNSSIDCEGLVDMQGRVKLEGITDDNNLLIRIDEKKVEVDRNKIDFAGEMELESGVHPLEVRYQNQSRLAFLKLHISSVRETPTPSSAIPALPPVTPSNVQISNESSIPSTKPGEDPIGWVLNIQNKSKLALAEHGSLDVQFMRGDSVVRPGSGIEVEILTSETESVEEGDPLTVPFQGLQVWPTISVNEELKKDFCVDRIRAVFAERGGRKDTYPLSEEFCFRTGIEVTPDAASKDNVKVVTVHNNSRLDRDVSVDVDCGSLRIEGVTIYVQSESMFIQRREKFFLLNDQVTFVTVVIEPEVGADTAVVASNCRVTAEAF